VNDQRALGEVGLSEAYDRLSGRLSDPDLGNPIVSLAETLEWCYTLEEHHKSSISTYYTDRNSSTDGHALGALVYARGHFTRTLVMVAHLVSRPGPLVQRRSGGPRGGSVTYQSGLVSEGYQWRSGSAIPPSTKVKPYGRDVFYQQLVENQPVLPPIDAAVRFLLGHP
jgi:hypothetical protein